MTAMEPAMEPAPGDTTQLDCERTMLPEPEGEEEEAVESDVMFSFDIPKCPAGTTLKVRAPDGVQLQIPLPKGIYPGDRMCMEKSAEGKWGIKYIERNELPAIELAANGQAAQRSKAQLEADLNDSNVCNVCLSTTKGEIRIRIVPSWAARGAQRFLQLVANKYYTDVAVYRSVPNFLVQFGLVNDAEQQSKYQPIEDDLLRGVPVENGSVCFAAAGPNTRTATVCIFLDAFPQLGCNPWETPIGKVAPESMAVLHSIYTGYGDMPQCGGQGPDPTILQEEGNAYIRKEFPLCDFVSSAKWLT